MADFAITRKPVDDERLASAILTEINALRRNPQEYAADLAKLRDCFEEKALTFQESGTCVQTIEGVAAVEDCLEDLSNVPSLTPLTSSQAVSRACAEHLADLQDGAMCSHVGKDGSTPEDRVARHGSFREQCGENIVFGALTAREVVYQMLIDDGAPERGHRANLLNMDFHFVGIAVGPHASAHMVVVLLFLDNFRASKPGDLEGKRYVVSKTAGEVLVPHPDASEEEATVAAWDRSMQSLKPDYMKVPKNLLESVERQHRGRSPRPPGIVQRYYVGDLIASPGINPAIVRAFVHRVDRDKDDVVQESEIIAVCYHHQLKLSPPEIKELFTVPHVKTLNKGDYEELGMDWAAIFKSMRPRKRWSPIVDINVECTDGRQYVLTIEVAALLACCSQLLDEAELDVPAPVDVVEANKALTVLIAQAAHLEMNKGDVSTAKSTALHNTSSAGTVSGHSFQVKLRQLLAPPGQAGYDLQFRRARCSNRRCLWAHEMSPHRETWLRLFHAVGLNPLVFFPDPDEDREPGTASRTDMGQLISGQGTKQASPSATRRSDLNAQRMQVKEPRPKQLVRQAGATPVDGAQSRASDRDAASSPYGGSGSGSGSASASASDGKAPAETASLRPQRPGEDERMHSENLINQKLQPTEKDSKSEALMSLGFDARRAFKGVLDTHARASDESRLMAKERRALGGTAGGSTLGATGTSLLGASGGTQMQEQGANSAATLRRGASLRAHFHNSCAVYSAKEAHKWPSSAHTDALKVQLNGEHIDQTKVPAQKADVKLSRMSKEERDMQFSCYFGKDTSAALKSKVASSQTADNGKYDPNWCAFEPRPDEPQRFGKFGRRVFDPQVRNRPVSNPFGISQIEARPQEEFRRQEERVQDILERRLPSGQTRPFKTYMSRAEAPGRQQELATHKRIDSAMQGERKSNERGFGQIRHSDRDPGMDMNLYTRPLNVSHMDRQLPLA